LERLAACSCNTAVSLSVVGALVRVDKGALIVVLLVPVDYCAGWSWRFCVKGRRKESISTNSCWCSILLRGRSGIPSESINHRACQSQPAGWYGKQATVGFYANGTRKWRALNVITDTDVITLEIES
jgi:hypothetical protein